jgi:hypothetical protein
MKATMGDLLKQQMGSKDESARLNAYLIKNPKA